MDSSAEARMARALISLEGLSVGDAFGERFFAPPGVALLLAAQRALPAPPWRFTDDTQMALSCVEVLGRHGQIDQDALARSFGAHYDITRGYGPAMHQVLPRIRSGKRWAEVARSLFGGQGSFGNGAAMRVAPVGAYFADDLEAAAAQAQRSAGVTHAHAEAAAGAIAVALAAAHAHRLREAGTPPPEPTAFLEAILPLVPDSEVQARIERARELPPETNAIQAAQALGNGSRVSAQDTGPFTLWCAAHSLDNYEEALWATVSALGDRDTTCAIVGGIVVGYTGVEGIPTEWREAREPLPEWHHVGHQSGTESV